MSTPPLTLARAGLPVADLRPDLAHAPGPLVFATVSGAHLYGFPSRDSDVDLRGATSCPPRTWWGCTSRRRPGPGCGSGTGSSWTSSPTTCGSSSG